MAAEEVQEVQLEQDPDARIAELERKVEQLGRMLSMPGALPPAPPLSDDENDGPDGAEAPPCMEMEPRELVLSGDMVCDVVKRPWDWNGYSFENAYVHVGREIRNVVSGNSGITSAGSYYVHVTHPLSGSVSVEVVLATGSETNDEDNTYLLVAELVADANNIVHQSFGIYAYPIVYLYDV